jgi:hypothetical protein
LRPSFVRVELERARAWPGGVGRQTTGGGGRDSPDPRPAVSQASMQRGGLRGLGGLLVRRGGGVRGRVGRRGREMSDPFGGVFLTASDARPPETPLPRPRDRGIGPH